MLRLPILVAAGGINSAGRTSNRRAFKRMVIEALDRRGRDETRTALAALMGTEDWAEQDSGTLVRRIEDSHFDPGAVPWARRVLTETPLDAEMPPTQITEGLPEEWSPGPGPVSVRRSHSRRAVRFWCRVPGILKSVPRDFFQPDSIPVSCTRPEITRGACR